MKHRVALSALLFLAGCGSTAMPDMADTHETSRTSQALSQASVDAHVRNLDAALASIDPSAAAEPGHVYDANDLHGLLQMGARAHAIYVDLQGIAKQQGKTLPADDGNWPAIATGGSKGVFGAQLARLGEASTITKHFFELGFVAHLLDDGFSVEHTVRVGAIENDIAKLIASISANCAECVPH